MIKIIFSLILFVLVYCLLPIKTFGVSLEKCLLPTKSILVIAHRGFSSKAPENTLAAFQEAVNIKADMIELDVTLSRDGEVVVIHDDTLDRTTNGHGAVCNYTYRELLAFNAGYTERFFDKFNNEKIPTLEQVLQKFGKNILINIELKDLQNKELRTELTKKVIKLVEENNLEKSVLISSFNYEMLKIVHDSNARIAIGVLSDKQLSPKVACKLVKNLNAVTYNPNASMLNKNLVNALHRNKIMILAWFKTKDDNETSIKKALKYNVDGIFTNYPDLLKKIIEKN